MSDTRPTQQTESGNDKKDGSVPSREEHHASRIPTAPREACRPSRIVVGRDRTASVPVGAESPSLRPRALSEAPPMSPFAKAQAILARRKGPSVDGPGSPQMDAGSLGTLPRSFVAKDASPKGALRKALPPEFVNSLYHEMRVDEIQKAVAEERERRNRQLLASRSLRSKQEAKADHPDHADHM